MILWTGFSQDGEGEWPVPLSQRILFRLRAKRSSPVAVILCAGEASAKEDRP